MTVKPPRRRKPFFRFEWEFGTGELLGLIALAISVVFAIRSERVQSPSVGLERMRSNPQVIGIESGKPQLLAMTSFVMSNAGGRDTTWRSLHALQVHAIRNGTVDPRAKVAFQVFLTERPPGIVFDRSDRELHFVGPAEREILNLPLASGGTIYRGIGIVADLYQGDAALADALLLSARLEFSDGTRLPVNELFEVPKESLPGPAGSSTDPPGFDTRPGHGGIKLEPGEIREVTDLAGP